MRTMQKSRHTAPSNIDERQTGRFCIQVPPTLRVGLVRLAIASALIDRRHNRPHRPALIPLFAKKFFRGHARDRSRSRVATRMRWTGQIFWLLAYGPSLSDITFFPPSPPEVFGDWPSWEVVSSYSSATAPDSHGISCADPLFQARKELDRELAACAQPLQELFNQPQQQPFRCAIRLLSRFQLHCHRRRRFHRLESHPGSTGNIPGSAY